MATHSSVLALRIPGTGEPDGLPSMAMVAQSRTRLKRLSSSSSRRWHPTPVLLPGKIPWMEEPGRLQSMGSPRVGHD